MSVAITRFRDDFGALAQSQPDAVALVDGNDLRTWTYGETLELITRCGSYFAGHGAGPAHPVMSLLPNSIEALCAFLATLERAQGFAPLAPDATAHEAVRWATLVRPALCLVCETTGDEVREALAEAGVATVAVSLDGQFGWLGPHVVTAASATDAPRLYLTTSGSTGEPRALVIDGDRLWSSGRAFCAIHDFLDIDARFFNILPMSYLGGLFNLGLIPLAAGGSVVIAPAFSGRSFLSFWQDVERCDITMLWLVPTIVRGLLAIADRTRRHEVAPGARGVHACFIGTAPIDLATKQRFETLFDIPLLENYGLSETTFLTSETIATRAQRREGSVGAILPYVEINCGAASHDGDAPGEVLAKTPFVFLGYLTGDGALDPAVDDAGFLATGDLGEVTADNELVLGGRLRDIIKKGGYLVPLREIEILAEQHPAVSEAIAVGLAHEFYGESYKLLLRLTEDSEPDAAIDSFGAWLRGNLVRYKWPDAVAPITDVPRTASGKVRKHLIAQQLASGGAP